MPFTNPTTSLSGDEITPGTITGSSFQTAETGRRIVVSPTPTPAIGLYSGAAAETGPGLIVADIGSRPYMSVQAPQLTTDGSRGGEVFLTSGSPTGGTYPKSGGVTIAGHGDASDNGYGQVYTNGAKSDGSAPANAGMEVHDAASGLVAGIYLEPDDLSLQLRQNGTNVYGGATNPGGWYFRGGVNFRLGTVTVDGSNVSLINGARVTNDQSWQALTLLNGWTNFGSGYTTASYRKMPDGTVMLRGLIVPPAGWVGGTSQFAALSDTTARPVSNHIFPTATDTRINAALYVFSSGVIRLDNGSGAAGWLSLGTPRWDVTG